MKKIHEIELCTGDKMTITVVDGGGRLESTIDRMKGRAGVKFNTAVEMLERLATAHACAGIDVTAPKYIEGLDTVFEAIGNEYGE